jgi:Protein of unknown function (DUF2510)
MTSAPDETHGWWLASDGRWYSPDQHPGGNACGSFDSRLELALAHFRANVDELVNELEAHLAQIEVLKQREPDHSAPPGLVEAAEIQQTRSGQPPAPAGWYGDPWAESPFRWWDGSSWTSSVHGIRTGEGGAS